MTQCYQAGGILLPDNGLLLACDRLQSLYTLHSPDGQHRLTRVTMTYNGGLFVIWLLTSYAFQSAVSINLHTRHNNDKALDVSAALELFSQIPSCAQNCILSAGLQAGCSITDIQCSCDSRHVNKQSTECVLANCTMRQALVTKNHTETMCGHPVRDTTRTIRTAATCYQVIEAVAYLLRIASKIHVQWPWNGPAKLFTQLWWDDVVITLALALSLGEASLARPITSPGLGHDVWTLQPHQVDHFAKLFFYGELLYIVGLSTVKISILLSYLRFFSSPRFRRLVLIVILLNLLYMTGFVIPTIFQCSPTSYWWKEWDGERPGHCIARPQRRLQALVWTSSAFNIVLDVIVLVMPVPLVWKMELNRRKKLLVIFMFTCGLFVTIVSILRLQSLVSYGETINPTWDYRWMARWSTIELVGMLLCACMPGIRNFIRRLVPKAVGETTTSGVVSIQPGLYERKSSQKTTGVSQGDDIETLVEGLEHVRLDQLGVAAKKRLGVRWSKASVDSGQLQQTVGWNTSRPRHSTDSEIARPGADTLNATAPNNTVLNATATLDDSSSQERQQRVPWSWKWLPWKRRSSTPSIRLSQSSQLTNLSTRRNSGARKTNLTSTTGSTDLKSELKSQRTLTPSISLTSGPTVKRSPSSALSLDAHTSPSSPRLPLTGYD